jgi:Trypsin-like peptidase domain
MTPHEFAQAVEKSAQPFTVMLAITTAEQPRACDVISNATGSLVDTGRRKLLITNHHVRSRFLSCRQDNPHAKLTMSGAHGKLLLDISDAEVLDLDKDVDLAVFRIPDEHVRQQGKKWKIVQPWPPRRPEKGMTAILLGYPGQGRSVEGDILGARALSLALPVVSVSDRHFVLVDESQDAHILVPEEQAPLTHFGGISGSAVYVGHTAKPQEAIGLCGFAYEEGPGGAIYVAHADHINADGYIRRQTI